ncbi:hypothetical protein NN561_010355 [Cricetulus griseus]
MPRAEAALELGGDQQPHRSAPSQPGGGVHVLADPRQPCAPPWPGPILQFPLQLHNLPGSRAPPQPALQAPRWKPSASGELRRLADCASAAGGQVTDGKLKRRLRKRAGDPEPTQQEVWPLLPLAVHYTHCLGIEE